MINKCDVLVFCSLGFYANILMQILYLNCIFFPQFLKQTYCLYSSSMYSMLRFHTDYIIIKKQNEYIYL